MPPALTYILPQLFSPCHLLLLLSALGDAQSYRLERARVLLLARLCRLPNSASVLSGPRTTSSYVHCCYCCHNSYYYLDY